MTRHAAPAETRPATSSAPRMRDRVPGQAVMERVLRARAALRPRSVLERLVGVDPIGPEALGWHDAVLAERAVASRLAGLPEGWTALHSLPVGRDGSDIGHLVVGPGGVFTVRGLDSRDASALVAGHAVLVGGRRRADVQRAQSQARRVDRIVAGVLADAPAVRPVIAVVGARRLAVRAQPAPARVLRVEHLAAHLVEQPARLAPPQVRALLRRLDDPGTWLPAPEAAPELLIAFAGLSRDVRRAAHLRTAWVTSLLALTTTGAAMLLEPVLAGLLGR